VKKRCLTGLAALLCLLLLLTIPAVAASSKCSLTLSCAVGGTPVAGVDCRLYRVAELNGTTFTPCAAFENARIELNGLTTAEQWQTAADSLAVYAGAAENQVQPAAEARSDSEGTISFSQLETGLYLAVFSNVTSGRTTWSFSPALYTLPRWDSSGNVTCDVQAEPKGTSTVTPHETTDVTVLKVWNDAGSEDKRPLSITLVLLRDGVEFDTVMLTKDNNWRAAWTSLPAGSTWTVLERGVADGYTVTYTRDGNICTVTNTLTTNIPDQPVPGGNVTPGTPGTNIPNGPIPTNGGELPKTGQLWWPVPVMAFLGLLFFAAGWRRKYRSGHEK